MRALSHLAANLTHDCGAKLQIAFADVEQPYTCPGCGVVGQIGPETMPGLMASFGRALLEVHRQHAITGDNVHLRFDCHTGTFSSGEPAHG